MAEGQILVVCGTNGSKEVSAMQITVRQIV